MRQLLWLVLLPLLIDAQIDAQVNVYPPPAPGTYTATPPLTIDGSNNIALPRSTASVDGYLSHLDFATFPTLAGTQTFSGTNTFSGPVTYSITGGNGPTITSGLTATALVIGNTSTGGTSWYLQSAGQGASLPGGFSLYNATTNRTAFAVISTNGNFRITSNACFSWTSNASAADQGTPDTYLCRSAAGVVNLSASGSGGIILNGKSTFSTAPACNAAAEGSSWAFTDSNTATFAATIAGGGSNHVRGYCNGTNWIVL